MAQGNYDHPSYVARQMDNLGPVTAGANGTSLVGGYPMDMRLRRMSATVVTAGTSAGAGNAIYPMILTGTVTTTLGTFTMGTLAANTVVALPDVNTLLPTGSLFFAKNGTDATGKSILVAEMHGDPLTGTWGTP
jgi:hypothetical protein